MVDLYDMIYPWFLPDIDIHADEIDEEYSTYNPALSSWALSVLTFVLWALPDSVVQVDPDRFLAQFDSTPYVLQSAYVLLSRSSSLKILLFPFPL